MDESNNWVHVRVEKMGDIIALLWFATINQRSVMQILLVFPLKRNNKDLQKEPHYYKRLAELCFLWKDSEN